MQRHPRTKLVEEAERKLREALLEVQKMALTGNEYLQVVNRVLSDAIASRVKYAIRVERHGDADTPGDAA